MPYFWMDYDVFHRDPDLVRLDWRGVVVLAKEDLHLFCRGPASIQHIKMLPKASSNVSLPSDLWTMQWAAVRTNSELMTVPPQKGWNDKHVQIFLPMYVQGLAKWLAPGCVNAAGKAKQK